MSQPRGPHGVTAGRDARAVAGRTSERDVVKDRNERGRACRGQRRRGGTRGSHPRGTRARGQRGVRRAQPQGVRSRRDARADRRGRFAVPSSRHRRPGRPQPSRASPAPSVAPRHLLARLELRGRASRRTSLRRATRPRRQRVDAGRRPCSVGGFPAEAPRFLSSATRSEGSTSFSVCSAQAAWARCSRPATRTPGVAWRSRRCTRACSTSRRWCRGSSARRAPRAAWRFVHCLAQRQGARANNPGSRTGRGVHPVAAQGLRCVGAWHGASPCRGLNPVSGHPRNPLPPASFVKRSTVRGARGCRRSWHQRSTTTLGAVPG